MKQEIKVPKTGKPFVNHANYCVGTGRLGLALQKEYLDHLDIVQDTIHFSYIRGHGLFCDDVGIYRECQMDGRTVPFYNFTYCDRIIDSYLERGIRPFLELGFMPEALKSGEQTIFYWKGNVTPPADYEKWAELIRRTLLHFIDRWGLDEVRLWPIEVWNEPNIAFWAGDMAEYFRLYDVTSRAVKSVDDKLQVGGPAICGVDTQNWLHSFFRFCEETKCPVDFITRHCYTANQIEHRGHYSYHTMRNPAIMIEELRETRSIMDQYDTIRELPLHITEFNSSYNPLCPVHDSVFNAGYIARILSEAGDYADSYSYWTFSDIFEECDVPKAPFHGGFGLIGLNGIKKPTFYTFDFFSHAGKELLFRGENVLITKDAGRYSIIAWSWYDEREQEKPVFSFEIKLPDFGGNAFWTEQRINEEHGNPVQAWYDMGMPRSLTKWQVQALKNASQPQYSNGVLHPINGEYPLSLCVSGNEIVQIEIVPVTEEPQEYLGFELSQFYGLKQK